MFSKTIVSSLWPAPLAGEEFDSVLPRTDAPSNDSAMRVFDAATGLNPRVRDSWEETRCSPAWKVVYDTAQILLTATFRRDGSSRFAPDNRWGNFPSLPEHGKYRMNPL